MTALADILVAHADEPHRCLEGGGIRDRFAAMLRPEIEQSLGLDPWCPESEYLTFFLNSAMIASFQYWYGHRDERSLHDISAMGQRILLGGIGEFLG